MPAALSPYNPSSKAISRFVRLSSAASNRLRSEITAPSFSGASASLWGLKILRKSSSCLKESSVGTDNWSLFNRSCSGSSFGLSISLIAHSLSSIRAQLGQQNTANCGSLTLFTCLLRTGRDTERGIVVRQFVPECTSQQRAKFSIRNKQLG